MTEKLLPADWWLADPVDENGVCLMCGGTGRYVSEHSPGALGIGHRYEGPCRCLSRESKKR